MSNCDARYGDGKCTTDKMASELKPVVLTHVTTVPYALRFLRGQEGYMRQRGFRVDHISSAPSNSDAICESEGVCVQVVPMTRQLTPLRDVVALLRLRRLLSRTGTLVLHGHTPKGGLLSMVAGWMTRVPVRVYHIHGLPFMTAKGFKRLLLKWTERVACAFANQVLCVSHSVREVAIAERLCIPEKIKVLRQGSINGVDACGAFNPERFGRAVREQVRQELGIPSDAVVAGFVGRLARDKGLIELEQAWRVLSKDHPDLHLLVVGPNEPENPLPLETEASLGNDPRIHLTGPISDTAPFYSAMDLLVLPSYREGLPIVPLEAGAMALPVVATCIPGTVEAVQDGVTGTLVPVHDARALALGIERYIKDAELRHGHGRAGRERVMRDFRQEVIWEALYNEYKRLLEEKGLPLPVAEGTIAAAVAAP